MHSLRYILTGKPHTFHDCLEYSHQHSIERVYCTLYFRTFLHEMMCADQCIARFAWEFVDVHITTDDVMGCIVLTDRMTTREKSLAKANGNLRERKDLFAKNKIPVIFEKELFPYKIL